MARAESASVRQSREMDALRIVALARLGVAALMIAATVVGAKPKWPQFDWVPWAYGAVAIGAAVLLFGGSRERLSGSRTQLVLLVIDVAAIVTYKVAAADGSYIPLLVLTLLPIMVVLDVSWRRAAAALVVIAATFAIELHTDPVMLAQAGRPAASVVTATFAFLCCTVFLTVYSQGRRIDEISALSASRQDLLVDLMAASDEQQRLIAEYIHDGPLQSVLMARQDVVAALKQRPDEGLIARWRLCARRPGRCARPPSSCIPRYSPAPDWPARSRNWPPPVPPGPASTSPPTSTIPSRTPRIRWCSRRRAS